MDRPDYIPEAEWDKLPDDKKSQISANRKLESRVSELVEMSRILKQDVDELKKLGVREPDNRQWRRSIYRAVFAWIEGTVYAMKQVAYHIQGTAFEPEFTPGEKAYLREESYALTRKGAVVTDYKRYSRLVPNLRFAFSALARGYGINDTLEVGDEGWQQFKEAIVTRNRVTHPKAIGEVAISNHEMNALVGTEIWFEKQLADLTQSAMAKIKAMGARLLVESQAEQQSIVDRFTAAAERSGDIDSIIKAINGMTVADSQDRDDIEHLKETSAKLEEFKQFILEHWDL